MKRTILLLFSFAALACFVSYYQTVQHKRAEELIRAAYNGDLIAVKNLIEEGAQTGMSLLVTDPERHYSRAQFSLSHAAASGGNEKILQYLIKQHLLTHSPNDKGWTPLFLAVRDGHGEYAAQLIEAGADINARTDTGTTALMLAFLAAFSDEKQRLSLIEYMLKKGADPNLQNHFQTDPLFYAVTELNDSTALQLLLDYKADVCRLYDTEKIYTHAKDKKIRSLLKKAYQKQCKN